MASYVHRVGRAGRLTGNSLVVALVRGRGKTLPVVHDPLSMINGAVQPPAAFLSAVEILRSWLESLGNLKTFGRNGLHRYNNQDHSMLTGLLAARNVLGEDHDLWDVNTERSYYEEQQVASERAG